jgi:hypothetical protein
MRCDSHASLLDPTLASHYFGRKPKARVVTNQVVDLDSLATWAKVIIERVALFKKVMPMAMENLSIAQHRNTLRYAHTQGSSYKSKVK